MEVAKRVAKNTGILYVQMGITVFMSLYTTRLVLSALGVEGFGIYNVVAGAIAMLGFLNVAMTAASQRFMSFAQGKGDVKKQKSIFNISLFLHFIIGILLVLILEIAGYFLFNGILKIDPERIEVAKIVYHIMVASTFFTINGVPYDAVINARENMLMVAVLRVIEVTLKLLIAIFITYSSQFDKLFIYGFLMAFIYLILYVIRLLYCHKKYDEVSINIIEGIDKPLLKEMTSFAGYSFLGSSSSIVANYGQSIVLNMFFGSVVNAAQGISGQINGQLSVFANTMLKALNPVIAKSEGAGDRKFMLKASLVGSKLSFFLLVLFFVPMLIEMPYVFNLWLKEVPDYAIVFCRLALIKTLVEQLFLTLITAISAVGKIKYFQIYSSVLNFAPILFSYLLFLMGYPPYYLYIVFIIFAIIKGGVIMFYAKKYCELSITYFNKNIVMVCFNIFIIVFVLSTIPGYFIDEASFFRLLLVTIISFISYIFVVWFIGLKSKEREMLRNGIKNLKMFKP
jgi:O-antigen/teichoic acid export membrane protein